jgi:hypothetical protein
MPNNYADYCINMQAGMQLCQGKKFFADLRHPGTDLRWQEADRAEPKTITTETRVYREKGLHPARPERTKEDKDHSEVWCEETNLNRPYQQWISSTPETIKLRQDNRSVNSQCRRRFQLSAL